MLHTPASHWTPDANEPPPRDLAVPDLLDEAVDDAAGNEAVVYPAGGPRWTYADLDEQVRRVAAALAASGLEPGDRAAIWATNVPENLLLQYAMARTGVISVPLNPLYRTNELTFVLETTGAKALFALTEHQGTSLWDIASEAAERVDALEFRVALGEPPSDASPMWGDFLESATPEAHSRADDRRRRVRPDDPAVILFTSGTTSMPKGATLTQWALANQGMNFARRACLTSSDRYLDPMPLFHVGGCVLGALGMPSARGCRLPVLMFNPTEVVETIVREQATVLGAVPTMLVAVEEEADRTGSDLSCIDRIATGGAPVPAELGRRWQERWGVSFVITYGQTELAGTCSASGPLDPPDLQISTCGKPTANFEMQVVEPGSETVVPVGQEGEFRVRGFVMRGYWADPEATETTLSDDGWLYTGDLGTLDAEGYVRVTGRAKDLVIRGGENIAPAAVEDAVRELPQVADVSVIGVPDEKFGQELCAYVRLAEGASLTVEEMRAALRDRVARYKIPRYLRVIDAFPTTPSGKIQKFRLREMFAAETESGMVAGSSAT